MDGKGKALRMTVKGLQRLNEPAFLALISNQALRRYIITGRKDLGMPDYATRDGRPDDFHPLSFVEIDQLVVLLASWRDKDPESK